MFAQGQITTDHSFIQKWVETRRGWPAVKRPVSETDANSVLFIGFTDSQKEDATYPISWNEFFQKFESENLVFLYQEKGDEGQLSRYFSFL